jgi:hypothetical protein
MERRANVLAWCLALAGALAIFASAVLGPDTIFAGDIEVFESARDRFVAAAWKDGEGIPRWAPGIAGGISARASQELGILYPPSFILAIAATDRAEALGLAIHLIIAVLGARALGRALGLEPAAALLVGFAYGFSGALVSEQLTPVYVRSGAWLPWAIAGLERASRGERRWLGVGILALAASYLAGDPQSCLTAAAATLVLAATTRGAAGAGRAALAVAAAGALAALVSAIQLVPAALAFAESERSGGLRFEDATRWSLQPLELLGASVPFAFGSFAAHGTTWFKFVSNEHERAWGYSVYLGPVVLALATCGLAQLREDRRARGGLALAVIFFALALGANTPLYRLVYALPGGASFRYPAKLLVPSVLGVAILAGVGAEALTSRALGKRIVLIVLGALGALALVGTNVAALAAESLGARIDALGQGVDGARAVAFLAPGFAHVALVACAALALVFKGKAGPRLGLTLAALVAVDLAIAQRAGVPLAPREPFTRTPLAASVLADAEKMLHGPARVLPTMSAERPTEAEAALPLPARDFVAEREGLAPNTALGYGVLSQGGFLSNYPERLVLLDEAKISPLRQAILQGASFVLAAGRQVEAYTEGGTFTGHDVGQRTLIYLDSAPPWARVVPRARFARDARAALAAITDPAFDPRNEAVIEASGTASPPGPAATGQARLVSKLGLHAFEVEVQAPSESWLVVREGYAPGWLASVNGAAEVPVLAADLVARGVRVPAGASRVSFRYVAPGENAGTLVTCATLAGLLVLALVLVARARRAPATL